jgi:hypothetical protein
MRVLRLPGVEPGSIAWKAIILTVGLQTRLDRALKAPNGCPDTQRKGIYRLLTIRQGILLSKVPPASIVYEIRHHVRVSSVWFYKFRNSKQRVDINIAHTNDK